MEKRPKNTVVGCDYQIFDFITCSEVVMTDKIMEIKPVPVRKSTSYKGCNIHTF